MEFPEIFDQVCARADAAAKAQSTLARATTDAKNAVLLAIADALDANAEVIAEANAADMRQSRADGRDEGKLARLRFDVDRVKAAAGGVRHVASLPDPVGQIVRGYTLPNGMRLTQTRVPIGVIGMIYEARPNVTVDVASLCLKSGNAAMLRGGHAAERTNAATLGVIGEVLQTHGFDSALVQSVDDFGRDGATTMMQARGHIDLLVPRGGRGLIQAVVANSKVPVIETGAGNVHIYMDRAGDPAKAIPIIINAKTQRIGVCNAAEKLIVHAEAAERFLPLAAAALMEAGVELHAVAQRLAGKDVEQAELDDDLAALDADGAGDQRLGIDRLPVLIGHGRIKAFRPGDMGAGGDFAKQPGAAEVGGDQALDLRQIFAGAALVMEGGDGKGHRLDHAIGDLDPQGAVLRLNRRGQSKTSKGHHRSQKKVTQHVSLS